MQNATHEQVLGKTNKKVHVAGRCELRSTESTFSNQNDDDEYIVCSLVGDADGETRV